MDLSKTTCDAVGTAGAVASYTRDECQKPNIRGIVQRMLDQLHGFLEAVEAELAKGAKQFWALYAAPIVPYHLQGFNFARVVFAVYSEWVRPNPGAGAFVNGKLHTAPPQLDWQELVDQIRDEAVRAERAARKPEDGREESEPALNPDEYARILDILRSMSVYIERNPAAFAALDEEGIRDHFLLQLNGQFKGGATGETVNGSGKTDILIRVRDRNVFIAECKFWHGQEKFDEAIDQLLSYLTGRDCKCALLIFNRNKDTTAVAKKIHEAMQARTEHKQTLTHDLQGDSKYMFVKADDPGREILITTQVFDVPRN